MELPEELQWEIMDFVDFLKFKHTKNEDELNELEKKEIQRRIHNAEKHPESLLTKEQSIQQLEKYLGRKIQGIIL